jgi:hypothetical protein
MTGKKRFWNAVSACVFLRKIFQNGVPSQKYPWSYRWLKFGDIKGETESTIVAAQDQAITTNYFKRNILKEETECRC